MIKYFKWYIFFLLKLALIVSLNYSCSKSIKRNPVPEQKSEIAHISGISNARFWGDEPLPDEKIKFETPEELNALYPELFENSHEYLSISGGGPNGAFSAGLLVGWTLAGDRPEFEIVTGISTGALVAPFAFLGSSYDKQLQEVFTTVSVGDISKRRGLLGLITGDSISSSKPLRDLISKNMNEQVVKKLAEEYKRGRRLYIITTNLDADRPVIWDITAIAASGSSLSRELIIDVLLASSSVPAMFPPVYIGVEADGRCYDEMHVDGGTSTQVFFYPASLEWGKKVLEELVIKDKPKVYVILNSLLNPKYQATDSRLLPIAVRSIRSLIRNQGESELYRIFLSTKRDGLDYNLAYIPDGFDPGVEEQFDSKYMKPLFDLGYEMARSGYPWKKKPPSFIQ